MTEFPPCFYRVSAKALIFKDGKVLLIKEPDGRWELPGGGLEVGESFVTCLTRELSEELGVGVKTISSQPLHTWTLINTDQHIIPIPKLILSFVVEVDSFNFKYNPEENVEAGFFSKQEMSTMNLHQNIQALPNLLI